MHSFLLGGNGSGDRAEHNYDTLEPTQVKDGDGKAARCQWPVTTAPQLLLTNALFNFCYIQHVLRPLKQPSRAGS